MSGQYWNGLFPAVPERNEKHTLHQLCKDIRPARRMPASFGDWKRYCQPLLGISAILSPYSIKSSFLESVVPSQTASTHNRSDSRRVNEIFLPLAEISCQVLSITNPGSSSFFFAQNVSLLRLNLRLLQRLRIVCSVPGPGCSLVSHNHGRLLCHRYSASISRIRLTISMALTAQS